MLRIIAATLFLFLVISLTFGLQQQKPLAAMPPASPPTMKTEDLLRIRNLQYERAKILLEMRQLETRYAALQDSATANQRVTDVAIAEAAKTAGVDMEKWIFDPDALKLVARPSVSPNPK